jgi:hypothetical protein
MKKILQNTHCILAFLLFFSLVVPAQAQTAIYIPDANFRAFLKSNYATCMVGDSLVLGCSAVVNAATLNVSQNNIANLTGLMRLSNFIAHKTLLILCCNGKENSKQKTS